MIRSAILVVAALAARPCEAASAPEPARAQALLTTYKCYLCHADDVPKAGPAYADVAAAYRGDAHAPAKIAAVIRGGQKRGGPWHMPPHPEVSRADADTMARYILSLDPATGTPRR